MNWVMGTNYEFIWCSCFSIQMKLYEINFKPIEFAAHEDKVSGSNLKRDQSTICSFSCFASCFQRIHGMLLYANKLHLPWTAAISIPLSLSKPFRMTLVPSVTNRATNRKLPHTVIVNHSIAIQIGFFNHVIHLFLRQPLTKISHHVT